MNKEMSMNRFDEMIQERIKGEYENVNPSAESLVRIKSSVKKSYENTAVINPWVKYYRVAAVILVMIILAVNADRIKAFALSFWERFLDTFQEKYEERTSDYVKDLNLEFEVGDTTIYVSQYVVSENGIEFRIEKPKGSNIEIYGCDFSTSWEGDTDVSASMFVWPHIDDYYLAMSYYEGVDFSKQGDEVTGELCLWYGDAENENGEIREKITLDFTDIYPSEVITNQDTELLKTEYYTIESISVGTWYMKVTYRKNAEWDSNSLLLIEQNGDMSVSLVNLTSDESIQEFYPLPDELDAPLLFSMAEVIELDDYEKANTNIRKIGESYEVILSDYIKKDK